MSHKHLLSLLGLILIAMRLFERGWMILLVWPGANFLVLGIAHGIGAHRVFGKRPNGTLPLWSWLALLHLRDWRRYLPAADLRPRTQSNFTVISSPVFARHAGQI